MEVDGSFHGEVSGSSSMYFNGNFHLLPLKLPSASTEVDLLPSASEEAQLPSTSREASSYFHLSPSTSVEASTNPHEGRSTRPPVSMEEAPAYMDATNYFNILPSTE